MTKLMEAMEAGKAAALSTTIGNPFHGAMPEAEKAGYVKDSPDYNVFITSFIHTLKPYTIEVDPAGKLVTGFYLKVGGE